LERERPNQSRVGGDESLIKRLERRWKRREERRERGEENDDLYLSFYLFVFFLRVHVTRKEKGGMGRASSRKLRRHFDRGNYI